MAAADSYLASFRPFTGFDSSKVVSDTFTTALGAIPAANATIAAGLANTALEQAGNVEGIKLQMDQRKWGTQQIQKNNRRQLALNLAQAFSGGSGSGGMGFMPLPGFDAGNALKMMYGMGGSSRAETRDATGRTSATAAGAMNNLAGLVKLQG